MELRHVPVTSKRLRRHPVTSLDVDKSTAFYQPRLFLILNIFWCRCVVAAFAQPRRRRLHRFTVHQLLSRHVNFRHTIIIIQIVVVVNSHQLFFNIYQNPLVF